MVVLSPEISNWLLDFLVFNICIAGLRGPFSALQINLSPLALTRKFCTFIKSISFNFQKNGIRKNYLNCSGHQNGFQLLLNVSKTFYRYTLDEECVVSDEERQRRDGGGSNRDAPRRVDIGRGGPRRDQPHPERKTDRNTPPPPKKFEEPPPPVKTLT